MIVFEHTLSLTTLGVHDARCAVPMDGVKSFTVQAVAVSVAGGEPAWNSGVVSVLKANTDRPGAAYARTDTDGATITEDGISDRYDPEGAAYAVFEATTAGSSAAEVRLLIALEERDNVQRPGGVGMPDRIGLVDGIGSERRPGSFPEVRGPGGGGCRCG